MFVDSNKKKTTNVNIVALIEKQGLEPLKNIFSQLGGWPVLGPVNWTESDFNWIKSVYKFRELGYSGNYFMYFGVSVDLKNSTQRIIDVSIENIKIHSS